MTAPARRPTGFAVFSSIQGSRALELAQQAAAGLGDARVIKGDDQTYLVLWGTLRHRGLDAPIILCRAARSRGNDVELRQVNRLLEDSAVEAGNEVLPPFAAIEWDFTFSRFAIEVDWLGLRHIYISEGRDWVGASSSATALATMRGGRVDASAFGIQAMLGWQLDLRTPFVEVSKLPPGSHITISRGRLSKETRAQQPAPAGLSLDAAVPLAAHLVSDFVSYFLDDHPDVVLQLTGGQDSRILLGAIPRSRRGSVEAMTLAVPGSADVAIASRIAREQGMKHRIVGLSGLESLTPQRAYEMCIAAARDLDCSADPLAFASLAWVESLLDQRPRLAGLGGEVARGFYYFGPAIPARTTEFRSRMLASWRLFPNEHVELAALTPEFRALSRSQADAGVRHALAAGGNSWCEATDEFYLWQRMQRWAGILASATCFDRQVVNPMLDHSFVEVARGLRPKDKQNMRFLSRILLELDPSLAEIELDNRPSPRTYSSPTPGNRARLTAAQVRKVMAKGRQKLSHHTHPAAGADVLAAKVLAHWRARPDELDFAYRSGFVRSNWLDELLHGSRSADPATIAFLLNLIVAGDCAPAISVSTSRNS